MQEVSGPEALLKSMVFPWKCRRIVELGQCFIISQVVAEVNFTPDDASYTYRGSAAAEDFAGILRNLKRRLSASPPADEMAVDGELTIKTTKSGGKLAAWSKNGANYTLYTPVSAGKRNWFPLPGTDCRKLRMINNKPSCPQAGRHDVNCNRVSQLWSEIMALMIIIVQ